MQNGPVLSILPLDRASNITPLINPTVNEDGQTRVDSRNQVMTQVIPLENVDAETLARELKELISKGASLIGSSGTNALIITDVSSNVQRFITLVDALDKTSNKSELRTYPLRRAEATAIADIINNLFRQITTRGRGGQPGGQPGQPQFNPGGQPQQPQSQGRAAVVAVADSRTNSVIVVASPDTQEKIASDIINRLDDDDTNTLETKIRRINFADAVQVANLVSSVLSNARAGGTGAATPSFQQRTFGFNPFGGGGDSSQQNVASTDPFGKVVADPRTNSVLITASSERMKTIDGLIDQLDKEVPVEPTTFVFPLKNAQADDVAYALSQAFGTGNNNGLGNFNTFFGFGGGGGGGNSNRRQSIQRRLSQRDSANNQLRSIRGRGVPPGPPNAPDNGQQGDSQAGSQNDGSAIPQGVQGVMTPQGFVPTQTDNGQSTNQDGEVNGDGTPKTRQFFGFGRQRGIGQVQGPQFGRGRTGAYSNLLQLQNNVFVTAAPGGDSLIITTTPDNYEALRQIIDALDVVPRQVMIEVIVAEVTLDASQKFGFSLSGTFRRLFGENNTATGQTNYPASNFNTGTAGTALDALAAGAQFAIQGTNYNAILQALNSDSKVRVLATPRVFTSNNQEALIDISQKIPYVDSQQSNGFNSFVTSQVVFQPVGFQLDVTPRITRQGLVTIDVDTEATSLLRFQTVGSGQSAQTVPVVNDRATNTSVTIQDNETVVIGGLLQDSTSLTTNKIPLLGDIPLLGQFFRSREKSRNKTELLIFMTPHVVSSIEEARALTKQQGNSVIRQIPELSQQQPNLSPDMYDDNGKKLPPKPVKPPRPDQQKGN